jgi:hypothetical protein
VRGIVLTLDRSLRVWLYMLHQYRSCSFPLDGGRLGWGSCLSKDALPGIIPTLTLPYRKGREIGRATFNKL